MRGQPGGADFIPRQFRRFELRGLAGKPQIVPGVSLTNRVIKTSSGIKQLQVVQERLEKFTINFVPDASFNDQSVPTLRGKLVDFLGAGIEFEFVKVSEIKRERSGKTRLCICRIAPPTKPRLLASEPV